MRPWPFQWVHHNLMSKYSPTSVLPAKLVEDSAWANGKCMDGFVKCIGSEMLFQASESDDTAETDAWPFSDVKKLVFCHFFRPNTYRTRLENQTPTIFSGSPEECMSSLAPTECDKGQADDDDDDEHNESEIEVWLGLESEQSDFVWGASDWHALQVEFYKMCWRRFNRYEATKPQNLFGDMLKLVYTYFFVSKLQPVNCNGAPNHNSSQDVPGVADAETGAASDSDSFFSHHLVQEKMKSTRRMRCQILLNFNYPSYCSQLVRDFLDWLNIVRPGTKALITYQVGDRSFLHRSFRNQFMFP